MKTAKCFFALLVLSANVVAAYLPASATEIPGMLSKDGFVLESGCPMPISALPPESFLGEQPVLKRPNSGELIDYYGPCGETPVGQDAGGAALDHHGWENNYKR